MPRDKVTIGLHASQVIFKTIQAQTGASPSRKLAQTTSRGTIITCFSPQRVSAIDVYFVLLLQPQQALDHLSEVAR